MKVDWVPLGRLLSRAGKPCPVDPTAVYPTLGVKSHARGAFDSGLLQGAQTAYSTLTQLRKGWIVYPKLMAWEGALALVPPELDRRWVTPEFVAYEVSSDALSYEYFRQLIAWSGFIHWVRAGSAGTNVRRRRLQPSVLEAISIPLPPRADQERIATHLSALGSGNTASSPHMKVGLRHLIAEASAGAPRKPIGELMRSSRLWIELDDAALYHPIGVRGFGRGMIRYPAVSSDALSKLRYYPVEPGALIISNIKAWEGAVCLAEVSDAGKVASNRFLQYVPTSDANAPWVEQYLLSAEGIESLGAASPGSADRNRTLSMAAFEAIEIPVPSPKIQQSVVNVAQALRQVEAQQARRDRLAAAIVPAARNEIFNALR